MSTSFTQLLKMWVVFFLGGSVALFMLELLFPQSVVFGTAEITPVRALFQSAALISLVSVGSSVMIDELRERFAFFLAEWQHIIVQTLANIGTIWLLSRSAEEMGFGISSWVVAVGLGLVLQVVQLSATKTILPELEY